MAVPGAAEAGREEEGEERDGRAKRSESGARPGRRCAARLVHRQRHDSAAPHSLLGAAVRGDRWEV